jgi:hypothetical protein
MSTTPPVVELNVSCRKPVQASVSIELWRRSFLIA